MCFLIGEQGFQAHIRAFAHSDSKCTVKSTAVETTLLQQEDKSTRNKGNRRSYEVSFVE